MLRLLRKMSPRHPKCCTCHTESSSCTKSMTTVSPNETLHPFKTLAKIRCHEKLPPKQPLISAHACQHLAGSAMPATPMTKCPMSRTCHAKRLSIPQNFPIVPRLPRKMDIAQKRSLRAGKSRPSQGPKSCPTFCASLRKQKPRPQKGTLM